MRNNSWIRLVFIQATVAMAVFVVPVDWSKATPLDDAMAYWRPRAFHCTDNGKDFPSKERMPTPGDASPCEDGDMTLFNGLLCAVGETIGCDGVRDSQSADGRWWRSPRRAYLRLESPNADVSFSPDQLLGVLLYAITTRDSGCAASCRACWRKRKNLTMSNLTVGKLVSLQLEEGSLRQ
jgi:hypothetical protein